MRQNTQVKVKYLNVSDILRQIPLVEEEILHKMFYYTETLKEIKS